MGSHVLMTYINGAAALPRQNHPNQTRKDIVMKDDIVIVGAVRTPVGAFNGVFGTMPAHELGKVAIKAAIDRAGVEPSRVSEVILGQILHAGARPEPGPASLDRRRHSD